MWIDKQMQLLVKAAADELAACSDGSRPCFVGVLPGNNVADELCDDECSQLTLILTDAFPTDIFPSPSDTTTGCNSPMAYSLEMRMARCYEATGPGGEPATVAEAKTGTERMTADMLAMKKAIVCNADSDGRRVALGTFTSDGPLGNVVAGTWRFTITRED